MATINGFHLHMSSLRSQEHKSQVPHGTNLLCLHESTPNPRSSSFNKVPRKPSHDYRLITKATSHASDSSPPEPHQVPAKSPFSAWKHWILGLTLSILVPSFRHKGGPFLALKSKVDVAMETVESVTEVVEELAEEVEKVSEQVADKLPDDAKLKKAMESVEHLAEEAVEKAKLAEDIIHKVKEVEEEVEEALIDGSDKKP
ncbi:hypothetical protein RchiOBHm_Chr2g0112261 [Rosa chinensis]|uniref:Uncharacterized protein n=1 Tax=Rosa chinensis TaxID=74649 RepID=A0A2P6RQ55_ROSCH|nr:uncharacterized protein LOC112187706 [Rosa chinensis]PRQ48575.1 hypothetical protein RchiOBHm_Chr2g0112261 [Rosa chinensis]